MEAFVGTALLLGLAGAPHCAAMCGAPCATLIRVRSPGATGRMAVFQAGRLTGYALAGAVAGQAMQTLAQMAAAVSALRPAWTALHLVVLAWGLMLLVLARQPAWADGAARVAWRGVQPLLARRGGLWLSGLLWTLLPCGLLYSALLVAALSGGPARGAVAMALFALGGALATALAPWLLLRLHERANRWRGQWGTRLAGLALAGAAGWALWLGMTHRLGEWCGAG